jgi:hypothetical protein
MKRLSGLTEQLLWGSRLKIIVRVRRKMHSLRVMLARCEKKFATFVDIFRRGGHDEKQNLILVK